MTLMFLVDSSVWIDVLQRKTPPNYHQIVASQNIVTCLPVIQEVLQGIDVRSPLVFAAASIALEEIRVLEDPLTRGVIDDAINLYRYARGSGFTIRSSVDCLIAACALRSDAVVVHRDRDFDNLAKCSPLRVIKLEGRSAGAPNGY